jgi:hypothetical protein
LVTSHHHPGLGQAVAPEESIVNATAPSATSQAPIRATRATAPAAFAPTATGDREVPLPAAERLRASLVGLGYGAMALLLATALALLIATGPFHTPLGSLA